MRNTASRGLFLALFLLLISPHASKAQTCHQIFDSVDNLVRRNADHILTTREKDLFIQAHREGTTPSNLDVSAYAPEATLMIETLQVGRSTLKDILQTHPQDKHADSLRALIESISSVEASYKAEKVTGFKSLNYKILSEILEVYLNVQTMRYVLQEGGNVEIGIHRNETLVNPRYRQFQSDFPYDILVPSAEKHGLTPFRSSNLGLHFIGLLKAGEHTTVDAEEYSDAALASHDLGHAATIARIKNGQPADAAFSKSELFERKLRTGEVTERIWSEIVAESKRDMPAVQRPLLTIVRFYIEHEIGYPLNSREGQELVARIATGRDIFRATEVITMRVRNKKDLGMRFEGTVSEEIILAIVQQIHRHYADISPTP